MEIAEVRNFVWDLFSQEDSHSKVAEYSAYFLRRICRRIVNKDLELGPDYSYGFPEWNSSMKEKVKAEADNWADFILEQDLETVVKILRDVSTCVLCEFRLKTLEDYSSFVYFKGMLLDAYENLVHATMVGGTGILVPMNNRDYLFRVKGILWDAIEDLYTGVLLNKMEDFVVSDDSGIAPIN